MWRAVQVWKNDIEMVQLLLDAGAKLDVKDGESGWCVLCRLLLFRCRAVLCVIV
jgi:hypothetical protein